jgi:hypothetical protein
MMDWWLVIQQKKSSSFSRRIELEAKLLGGKCSMHRTQCERTCGEAREKYVGEHIANLVLLDHLCIFHRLLLAYHIPPITFSFLFILSAAASTRFNSTLRQRWWRLVVRVTVYLPWCVVGVVPPGQNKNLGPLARHYGIRSKSIT